MGFILAAAGSAVGVGNLWKFPYITWENNGGAFVLVYIACVALIGLPIMSAELLIGRKTRQSPVPAMFQLGLGKRGGKKWSWVGWMGIAGSAIILSYVTVIAGWAFVVFIRCLNWSFNGYSTPGPEHFSQFLANTPLQMLLGFSFSLLTALIVIRGISGGIERANRILMPALFLMLLVLVSFSFSLPGFRQSLVFLFEPRFSELNIQSVLEAMGQAFFSLSLAMGVMITYGSYLKKQSSIVKNASVVVTMDTMVALFASIVMYTIIFTFPEIQSGLTASSTGMLFTTLPPLFYSKMSIGPLLAPIFYLLVVFAGISSTISLLEVVVALFIDHFKMTRIRATVISASIVFIMTIMVVLSLNPSNIFSRFSIFGNPEGGWLHELNMIIFRGKMGFMNIADHLVANWLLPLTGLLTTLFVGWMLPANVIRKELYPVESTRTILYLRGFIVLIRYVAPISILYILYNVVAGTSDFT